jgi:predicted TPR repeat methyltransferase
MTSLSKAELSRRINQILGLKIQFERMEKADLERFYEWLQKANLLTFAAVARKATKKKVLERHSVVKTADGLVGFLLSILKRD